MGKEAAHIARATLELDLEQGPPRGALTEVNGRRWPFFGWIALASALEAWRDVADPQEVGVADEVGNPQSAPRGST